MKEKRKLTAQAAPSAFFATSGGASRGNTTVIRFCISDYQKKKAEN